MLFFFENETNDSIFVQFAILLVSQIHEIMSEYIYILKMLKNYTYT